MADSLSIWVAWIAVGMLPNIWHEIVHSGKQNWRDEHHFTLYTGQTITQSIAHNKGLWLMSPYQIEPQEVIAHTAWVTTPCLLTSNHDTSYIFHPSQALSTDQENKSHCLRGSNSVSCSLCVFWSKAWQTQQISIMSVDEHLQPCANIYGQTYKKVLLGGL